MSRDLWGVCCSHGGLVLPLPFSGRGRENPGPEDVLMGPLLSRYEIWVTPAPETALLLLISHLITLQLGACAAFSARPGWSLPPYLCSQQGKWQKMEGVSVVTVYF